MMERHFVDERHNLYVGWVLGIALNHGLHATPVLDEHENYTDRIAVALGESMITVVVPPPPEDWPLAPAHRHRMPERGYPLGPDTPAGEFPRTYRDTRHPPCERCASRKSERVHTPEDRWLCWNADACEARSRVRPP